MAASMLAMLTSACSSDSAIAIAGDSVAVHYNGTLDDGTVFDSSLDREPLEFTVGAGQVIPGFDSAVDGLAVGESVTVRIPPAEAYGEIDANDAIPVDLTLLPELIAVGDQLNLDDGSIARIVSVADEEAMIVIIHPLAGQALTFEITLEEIQ